MLFREDKVSGSFPGFVSVSQGFRISLQVFVPYGREMGSAWPLDARHGPAQPPRWLLPCRAPQSGLHYG